MVASCRGRVGCRRTPAPSPSGAGCRTPTVGRRRQVAVAGQAVGDDELALAGAAGDRGLAGVACKGVRRRETARCGRRSHRRPWRRGDHRGRESSGRSCRQGPPGPARPPVAGGRGRGGVHPAAARPCAAPRPAAARRWPAAGSRPVGWCRPWRAPASPGGEVVGGQRGRRPCRRTGRASRAGRPGRRRPARRARLLARAVAVGQRSSSRSTVGAPRSSPAIVSAAGKVAIRSARSRFTSRRWSRAARSSSRAMARSSAGQLAVGDQRAQAGVAVQRQQAAMRASSASSFLRAGPRRRAIRSGLTGTTVYPASTSALDEQAVAGLDHHPDLGRVRLSSAIRASSASTATAGRAPPGRTSITPSPGPPRATRWNSSAQSIPTPSTGLLPVSRTRVAEARRRADGPVLTGRHPCGRQASAVSPPGRRLL